MRSLSSWLLGIVVASGSAVTPALALEPTLDDRIKATLDVDRYDLVTMEIPALAGEPFAVDVEFDGVVHTLVLEPHSIRHPDFRLLIDDGTGAPYEVPATAPRTYRGEIFGVAGGAVAAALLEDGLHATVFLPGKDGVQQFGIQPLLQIDPEQPWGIHVVYENRDIVPLDVNCGTANQPAAPAPVHRFANPASDPVDRVDIFQEAEIALDADFQYFQSRGSSSVNVTNDVDTLLNGVAFIYERDTDITYRLTELVIRTTSGSNPYNTNNASSLLQQFQNWWNANKASTPRDVAHLFTGRNIDGGTIGIAYLSVICNRASAYGVNEVTFTSNLNSRLALIAHELGHNWSAQHCSGGTCRIMCAGLGGCGGIGAPNFGPTSITSISNFRNSRTCLQTVVDGALDLPFLHTFPVGGVVDPQVWEVNSGGSVQFGINPPSLDFVLNLDSADSVETFALLAAGAGNLELSYWWARSGVENGEALIVEMQDSGGNWVEVDRVTSNGTDQLAYTRETVQLGATYSFDGTKLRLRTNGNAGNDDWFIDDVAITPVVGIPLPLLYTVPVASVDTGLFPTAFGTTASTAASNEPSAPNSLAMTSAGRLETDTLRAASFAGQDLAVGLHVQESNTTGSEALFVTFDPGTGVFQNLGVIALRAGTQSDFRYFEFTLPQSANNDDLRIAINPAGAFGGTIIYLDDIYVGEPTITGGCSPADLSSPAQPGVPDGSLTGADFFEFLNRFGAGDLSVDFSSPASPGVPDGTLTGADFFEFLNLFAAGC